MKMRFSLAFRIAFVFSLFVTLLMGSVFAILAVRIGSAIHAYVEQQNLEIARARADQVGQMIEKIFATMKALSGPSIVREEDLATARSMVGNLSEYLPKEVVSVSLIQGDGNYTSADGTIGTVSDRDYYKEIVSNGKEEAIGTAAISKNLNVPIVAFARAVRTKEKEFFGLMICQVRIEDLSKVVAGIRVGEKGYGWLVDRNGLVIAHGDPEIAMKQNILESDEDGYDGLGAFGQRLLAEEFGSGEWRSPDASVMVTYFYRVPKSPGWSICLTMSKAEVDEIPNAILHTLVLVLVVGLAASFAVSLLLAHSVVDPLRRAASGFRELAEGDADLTVSFQSKTHDEVGDLIRDFNAFIEKLREIVKSLKHSQEVLTDVGEELGESVSATKTTIAGITDSVRDVHDMTETQETSVAQSSSAVEEIAKNIESLDRLIIDQAASITEASSSIEEMVGNIDSMGASMDRMVDRFGNLLSSSEEGKSLQSLSVEKIQLIAERSRTLLEANEVIAGIASQTNLLAMNAAIEAAHAGEAGKGFSVVADEIRRLAETSAEQSRAITAELALVESAIQEVVEASRNSETAFEQVGAHIVETDALVHEIRQAMSEQQQGSKQILEALRSMNEVTSQVRIGSSEMSGGNQTLLDEMVQLRNSSGRIGERIKGISDAGVEIGNNTDLVTAMAENTRKTIQDMEKAIGRFKV